MGLKKKLVLSLFFIVILVFPIIPIKQVKLIPSRDFDLYYNESGNVLVPLGLFKKGTQMTISYITRRAVTAYILNSTEMSANEHKRYSLWNLPPIDYTVMSENLADNLSFKVKSDGEYYFLTINRGTKTNHVEFWGRATYLEAMSLVTIIDENTRISYYAPNFINYLLLIVWIYISIRVAIAVFRDAKQRGYSKEIWFLIGAFFGVFGGLIYIVFRYLDTKE